MFLLTHSTNQAPKILYQALEHFVARVLL